MAELDKEVFEVEKVAEEETELIEQKKKGRKPMSDKRKAQLREQLKKAREKKKEMKKEGTLPPKDPKASKVIKVLDQVGGDEPLPPVYVRNVKRTKDHSKDIAELKSQIAELKAHNNNSDKEELKMLREEMKKIKEEKKRVGQESKQQAKKVAEYSKPPPKAPQPKAKGVAEVIPAPRVVPTARYSTYQKSIWSKFL